MCNFKEKNVLLLLFKKCFRLSCTILNKYSAISNYFVSDLIGKILRGNNTLKDKQFVHRKTAL